MISHYFDDSISDDFDRKHEIGGAQIGSRESPEFY